MAQILAIDDSRSIRQMVSLTLTAAGHEVAVAEDGREGYEMLQKSQPDLVITDINMPVMDGLELIQKVRGLNNHRFTPILVLTTESAIDMKQHGKNVGATGWIVKPFSPDRFVALVERVLNR